MYASHLLDSGKDSSWAHERSFNLHLKKLEAIRGRTVRASSPTSFGLRASLSRLKALSYLEAERIEAIKRENRLLMRKLVAIAEAKNERAGKGIALRSLNVTVRKREEDRIRSENEAFNKRLLEKECQISKKQLDLSFNASQRYRRQISKSSIIRSKFQQKKAGKPSQLAESDSEAKATTTEVKTEVKAKYPTQSYSRTTEFSPLNRTGNLVDSQRQSDQPLDSKGDIAVIADGKKFRRRTKAATEIGDAQTGRKPQHYSHPTTSDASQKSNSRKGSLSPQRASLTDRKGETNIIVEERASEMDESKGDAKANWETQQKMGIKASVQAKKPDGNPELSTELTSKRNAVERKPGTPKKPTESLADKPKKPISKPVEKPQPPKVPKPEEKPAQGPSESVITLPKPAEEVKSTEEKTDTGLVPTLAVNQDISKPVVAAIDSHPAPEVPIEESIPRPESGTDKVQIEAIPEPRPAAVEVTKEHLPLPISHDAAKDENPPQIEEEKVAGDLETPIIPPSQALESHDSKPDVEIQPAAHPAIPIPSETNIEAKLDPPAASPPHEVSSAPIPPQESIPKIDSIREPDGPKAQQETAENLPKELPHIHPAEEKPDSIEPKPDISESKQDEPPSHTSDPEEKLIAALP